jgi:hypothetical protein
MNDVDILAYVRAAAGLLELPLDDSRAHAVALHLGRTRDMAKQLEAFPLSFDEEMSEIFLPGAFPTVDHEDGMA